MWILRKNSMGVVSAALLQAAAAISLLHPEALIGAAAAERFGESRAVVLAVRAFASATNLPRTAERSESPLAAEHAVPPFAMFLVDAFASPSPDLSSSATSR